MAFRKLEEFKDIFDRPDFSFIASHKRIADIINIILYKIVAPDGHERDNIATLETYLERLTTFYRSISGQHVPDIHHGFLHVKEQLTTCINLFSEPRRDAISRGSLNRFAKRFEQGLAKIHKGLFVLFDPDIVGSTIANKVLVVNFIVDNIVGLGKKHAFNKKGKHAFMNKIGGMNLQELIVIMRLLIRPSGNQVRTFNGWRDLGIGGAPVRLLVHTRSFGKDQVCFLYKANEHPEYEAQLQTPPEKVLFSA